MYEVTLVVIKPDGYSRRKEIKKVIADRGFEALFIKEPYRFTRKKAAQQYEAKRGASFLEELLDMMTEGDTSLIIYGKENAIEDMANLVGFYKSAAAEPGTLRYEFGDKTSDMHNAVHRSDSRVSVLREVYLHFDAKELPADVKRILEHYKIETKRQ